MTVTRTSTRWLMIATALLAAAGSAVAGDPTGSDGGEGLLGSDRAQFAVRVGGTYAPHAVRWSHAFKDFLEPEAPSALDLEGWTLGVGGRYLVTGGAGRPTWRTGGFFVAFDLLFSEVSGSDRWSGVGWSEEYEARARTAGAFAGMGLVEATQDGRLLGDVEIGLGVVSASVRSDYRFEVAPFELTARGSSSDQVPAARLVVGFTWVFGAIGESGGALGRARPCLRLSLEARVGGNARLEFDGDTVPHGYFRPDALTLGLWVGFTI